jgi:L-alanine-DL-glutamate epimerase-like enolase superfamily enzyme
VKITALRCILVSGPYATPDDAERLLHLKTGFRPASLIKVETDDGAYGLGETYAGVYAPEAVAGLVAQFAHDLIGEPAFDTLALWGRLRLASSYWGRAGLSQSVIGGIETALWDLKGKVLGQPVCALLGGKRHDALPAYASGGNDKPFDQLAAELRGYLAAGYRAIKIRINNLTPQQIEEKVAVSRNALGAGPGLAVDAVQGTAARPWSTKTAVAIAKLIEPYDILWLEEPAEVTNYAGFAEIRRRASIPVAGGETVTSLLEAERYIDADALDLFQPDATMIGGIGMFRRVAELCERRFVPVAAHAWSSGVGIMANYHAAFASPNCAMLELPNVPNPLRDELLTEPLRLVDGKILTPTAPGLGVTLPDDLEARYPYRPGTVYRVLGN